MAFGQVFNNLAFKRYDCIEEKDSVCRLPEVPKKSSGV